MSTGEDETADRMLRAIAEPRRRAIVRLVSGEEMAAGEIAARFSITRTAVSQHLTVLRDAGLLTERRDGTRRLYRADARGLIRLRALLEQTWAGSLDAARSLAEAENGIMPEDGVANAG